MLYFILIYSLIVILLAYSFKKKGTFSNYTGDEHQFFANKKNIPLVGGIFLLLPIIVINYQNLYYNILVMLVFLIGFFSDQKILISPKKRFLSHESEFNEEQNAAAWCRVCPCRGLWCGNGLVAFFKEV